MMKTTMASCCALALLTGLSLVATAADSDPVSVETPAYDKALAHALGADQYGMKPYVMAFLKAGPNRSGSKEQRAELQRAHMSHIQHLAQEGKLVLAGPFIDGGEWRGIYIFDVASLAEAEALTASDPAVQAGSLAMELKAWYGSAALLEVNRIHTRIAESQP
ncbi:YciI family protein [Shewanella sp. 38A_GOM-205m]|uniref:YciI family protein n=1 Tax=Shewanella sp. 38A_GOM-205m TaxID=1380363 RepID=UPI0004B7AEFA|nr:YciI family protein [Shewanella sp. 38A_GOM-205m]